MIDKNLKRILLITDHFPPEQSGGSGRSESLHRFLPKYGIEVFVITVDYYGRVSDEKNVFRYQSYLGWQKNPLSSRFWSKFPAKLRARFTLDTDDWWIKQVLKDKNKIADLKCDAIYASYPSISAMILGLQFSQDFNIPLISEFRDGLCLDPVEKIDNKLKKAIFQQIEAQIVLKSVAIVTVSTFLSSYFDNAYRVEKTSTVYNGYNSDDFDGNATASAELTKSTISRFVYFGSLAISRSRDTSLLFGAISELVTEKKIVPENFKLDFIGRFTSAERAMIKKYNLEKYINFLKPMPKKSGFSLIKKEYDYLLFFGIPNTVTFISAKLPEYLALDKPILGICRGNESATIIDHTGTGETCDFEIEDIKAGFLKFINKSFNYKPNRKKIEEFNRLKQAEQIALIIRKVITK